MGEQKMSDIVSIIVLVLLVGALIGVYLMKIHLDRRLAEIKHQNEMRSKVEYSASQREEKI